jgi:dTDP-4-amino-4,6-dideoxygalactose transaminase
MDTDRVPLVDLKAQHRRIAAELDEAMRAVVESTSFVRGPECAAFEQEFAEFCEARHACGVGNGTDALRLALWALGVGPGDEVITVAFTFIATAEAIVQNGARPVFVDVDQERLTMDPAGVERALTPRTKAIVPVHLYGQPADMGAILSLAGHHGIPVVEDAAQAHGARWQGQRAGSLGQAGCFSFYPGKNLGAYGDAGAVVSNDDEFLARVRRLANHGGGRDKYQNLVPGTNSRLDALQAAVLRVKLRHLDRWNEERRARARLYQELLAEIPGVVVPGEAPDAPSVWHLFVIRVVARERLSAQLAARGIATAVHYPTPLHQQPAMTGAGVPAEGLPVTERLCQQVLSLPMYPELPLETVRRIAGEIRSFLR